jgi:hypothetical protein
MTRATFYTLMVTIIIIGIGLGLTIQTFFS